jgi:hypothetical protein
MIRFSFFILIAVSVMIASCSSRKPKLDKKNLIPEKELVSLLTDIHLSNGLLFLPQINAWASSLDSITSYYQVIEAHGYTKEIMDKTMKYYFLNNPKKLNKIYDQVLGILSAMESRVEKESLKEMSRFANLWTGKEFYCFPSLSVNDSILFDLTLFRPGYYTLSFSVTIYPDDQSINPKAFLYTSSPDSIDTGKRKYLKSSTYLKDGRPHTYTLIISSPEQKINHLRGWLYDFENRPSGFEKHIKIENISLSFSSVRV